MHAALYPGRESSYPNKCIRSYLRFFPSGPALNIVMWVASWEISVASRNPRDIRIQRGYYSRAHVPIQRARVSAHLSFGGTDVLLLAVIIMRPARASPRINIPAASDPFFSAALDPRGHDGRKIVPRRRMIPAGYPRSGETSPTIMPERAGNSGQVAHSLSRRSRPRNDRADREAPSR